MTLEGRAETVTNQNEERKLKMNTRFHQIGKFVIPALLAALMAGCATQQDLQKVQKQVDEVRMTANSAQNTANEAKNIASEARAAANSAQTAANAAVKASSDASGFSAAAVKGSEAAVKVATDAQKTVNEATIAFPWMKMDPATGRLYYQWVVWPNVLEYTGGAPAPAAPEANGPKP